MDLVPTVDISSPGGSGLADLDRACRDHGFFLLCGHGLDGLIDRTWDVTRTFFATDESVKGPIRRDADNPLGYHDRELTKRRRDHKEVFDFVDPIVDAERGVNRWPAGEQEFHDTMTSFFDAFAELADRTSALVRAALDVDDAAPIGIDRSTSTVRLNHYPVGDPVPDHERDGLAPLGETALGYHTDPGVLTLLLQDDTGGLQAESLDHGWIDVPPQPGTVVVNMADVMQVWTNDRYRAAVHRVVPMTTTGRYSIPFFANPPRHTVVEPLATLIDGHPRYRPFAWRDFMAARSADNYVDAGTEDAQIADYATV